MDIYEIRKANLIGLIGKQKKASCAARWDMSPAHLSQILSNRTEKNIGDEIARRVEEAESLPRGWLDSPRGNPEQNLEVSQAAARARTRKRAEEGIGPYTVAMLDSNEEWAADNSMHDLYAPFFQEVSLTADGGRTAVELSHDNPVRFDRDVLRQHNIRPTKVVCVTATGNSMEPVLPHGSIVGIDQATTSVIDGKMYALNHGGQLRVKMLYRLPGGGLRMRSYNRDEHPDEEYVAAEMESKEIVVIGRVFWYSVLL